MVEKRKRYGADLKFRVALEAAKGQKTLNELASERNVSRTFGQLVTEFRVRA